MKTTEEAIRARFRAAGQEHVLKYLPVLTKTEKMNFLQQLAAIDVENLSGFLVSALEDQRNSGTGHISPFSKNVVRTADKHAAQYLESSRVVGLEAISQGKVAALVLAGGQGTRLGFNGPKGMYDIGLPSRKSLFQLIAERLLRLGELSTTSNGEDSAKPVVAFYIMTSPLNHSETVSFFQTNSFFGLKSDNVRFFSQGMLPCLTDEGRIILESPSRVSMAPDGNGGIYPSLVKSDMLTDMTQRGIQYLHVFSIDNALVRPADPAFVGHCISQRADCGNKVLWKAHAHEKVGVLAERDGKPCIVEYSEISKEMAEKTDDQGRLVFGAGNICNHFFTLDFLRDVVVPNLGNMYHIANKKIPYYDEEKKETITPTANNGVKLESFIFDVFPMSKEMTVLDVARSEEFAPVKNAPGSPSDSPDTACKMMSHLAKKWVQGSGGTLAGDVASICEISPLVSFAGEGLTCRVQGQTLRCPFSI